MKKLLSIALIIFMGLPGVAFSQSAKDAYKALKKVEARVETGISYKDYPQVIAEAKVEVDMFLEGKEAKNNPQFIEHIKKAMGYYMNAGKIWDIMFGRLSYDVIKANSQVGSEIRQLYPKANAEVIKPQERLLKLQNIPISDHKELEGVPVYYIPEVLRNIWGDASKELKKASEYLRIR